jgi:dimethylamine/trimethylamine dehydrogenase
MARDPRYDILFEPVRIGPKTTKNRFYQVPHCNGIGDASPRALAALREVKAEGGWGVVCTEACSVHPSAEFAPYPGIKLWDQDDVRVQALMTEAVHRHGALAGVELWYGGSMMPNPKSREIGLGAMSLPVWSADPVQGRAMDKEDIRKVRQWHVDATKRAKQAGFDIIYIYASERVDLPFQFLSQHTNQRSDEYGGTLENRVRLMRELIEDAKEAVGDDCAIAVRFAVDELVGTDGIRCEDEGREVVEMLAELPDLWDVNIAEWPNDSGTSRFTSEGFQERFVSFVKSVTTKPVVGVGRFTSPDTMVSQIRRGILDLIGAARPSIADPFLPKKIEEGRIEDIRECIGCNICVSGQMTQVPMMCTQNPTMSEEWRRGWHPERITPKGSDDTVLIVGGGPAGLECAVALGNRGYKVHLAEAGTEFGGRITVESRLPGLAEWKRVCDYRTQQIGKLPNIEVYRSSHLTADDVREFAAARLVVATGAHWRKDGLGRRHAFPIPGSGLPHVISPDDVMAGAEVSGPVVIFDDDHYYMGSCVAEKLQSDGLDVTLITPAPEVSTWTRNTLEQEKIQAKLIERGIKIVTANDLTSINAGSVEIACIYSDRPQQLDAASIILVTCRTPDDQLYYDLMAESKSLEQAGIKSVTRIGDCLAPGTIASAVRSGHHYARALDTKESGDVSFRQERVAV